MREGLTRVGKGVVVYCGSMGMLDGLKGRDGEKSIVTQKRLKSRLGSNKVKALIM